MGQEAAARLKGPERKARRQDYLRKMAQEADTTEGLAIVQKLVRRDLREMVKGLSEAEVRDLVDLYYTIQDNRKGTGSQIDFALDAEASCKLLAWVHSTINSVEDTIRRALDEYTELTLIGQWSKSIVGVGPVLSAGLQAHIDINKAKTAGHIWRFAGLTPDIKWEKGQRRPFNLRFKVICWKLGDSFMKHRTGDDFYGRVYEKRKQLEWSWNVQGKPELVEQAKGSLQYLKPNQPSWAWGAGCYSRFEVKGLLEQGIEPSKLIEHLKRHKPGEMSPMLSPGWINLRAQRVAVKLFLSHWYEVASAVMVPDRPIAHPYAFTFLGHDEASYIAPPNWPLPEAKGRQKP